MSTKRLKRKYRQKFLKHTFLPAELERGTKALQFDVCFKAKISTVVVTATQFCVWTRY